MFIRFRIKLKKRNTVRQILLINIKNCWYFVDSKCFRKHSSSSKNLFKKRNEKTNAKSIKLQLVLLLTLCYKNGYENSEIFNSLESPNEEVLFANLNLEILAENEGALRKLENEQKYLSSLNEYDEDDEPQIKKESLEALLKAAGIF